MNDSERLERLQAIVDEMAATNRLICLRAFIPIVDGRCGECVNCRCAALASASHV